MFKNITKNDDQKYNYLSTETKQRNLNEHTFCWT